LRIDGSAVDVNRYRFAQWSEVHRLEITCAKAPDTFRSLVSMPTGTNAIIVNLEPTTDTIDCLSRLAVVHQNLGAAAMIVLALLVEMGTYGARLCAPAATVRALRNPRVTVLFRTQRRLRSRDPIASRNQLSKSQCSFSK